MLAMYSKRKRSRELLRDARNVSLQRESDIDRALNSGQWRAIDGVAASDLLIRQLKEETNSIDVISLIDIVGSIIFKST